MTDLVPWSARRILTQGVLCHLAVRTPSGPHLTPVVFVFDGGRVWLSTSRSSVKARTWKHDPEVSGLVRVADRAVTFRGRVRTYDALDPLSWPAATVGAPWLLRAATRFTLKNARFFGGYAVDAGRVPLAWSPPGRVFVRVRPVTGWLLDEEGEILERWGDHETTGAGYHRSFRSLPPARGLDLRAPAAIRRALGPSGTGPLALQPEDAAPLVFPARWRRVASEGTFDAVVPRRLVELTGAGQDVPAALTMDQASSWRASEMSGVLLQGTAAAYAPGETRRGADALRDRILRTGTAKEAVDDAVLFRLRPSRAVWWRGWTSGAVAGR